MSLDFEAIHEEWRTTPTDLGGWANRAAQMFVEAKRLSKTQPSEQFLNDVRATVAYHWSGLPERRPDESVWARLDAVLFDDDEQERPQPDYDADPLEAA